MPRKKEQSEQIREERRRQILDAALTVYVRGGYDGTDMDSVAAQAGMAKGLLYYYYRTKRELFRALYGEMLDRSEAWSRALRDGDGRESPLSRLASYAGQVCSLACRDPRLLQFLMRMPFDARAVFGAEEWREGVERSLSHRRAMERLVRAASEAHELPALDADMAANCFWSVLVAGLFDFTRLMAGAAAESPASAADGVRRHCAGLMGFCFRGLGAPEEFLQKHPDLFGAESKEGEADVEQV